MRTVTRIAVVATGAAILAVAFATAAAQGGLAESAVSTARQPSQRSLRAVGPAVDLAAVVQPAGVRRNGAPEAAGFRPAGGRAETVQLAATPEQRRYRALDTVSSCLAAETSVRPDGAPDGGREPPGSACSRLRDLALPDGLAIPIDANVRRAEPAPVVIRFDSIVVNINFGG